MRRVLWTLAVLFTLALLVAGAGGYWLFCTEDGLLWIVAQVPRFAGPELTLGGVRGTLVDGIAIERLEYRNPDTTVTAEAVTLRVAPSSLVFAAPYVSDFHCAQIAVSMKETKAEPRKPPASLALPIRLYVHEARIDRVLIERGDTPIDIRDISFSYGGGGERHRLRDFKATLENVQATADVDLGTASPFPISAKIAANIAGRFPVTASAQLQHSLIDLGVAAKVTSGTAQAQFAGTVLPFDEKLLQQASAKLTGVNLRAFDATLPETDLSGTFALRRDRERFSGPLQLTNARAGTWEQQRLPLTALTARVRTDLLTAADLSELAADFGRAGRLAGTGEISRNEARFRLSTTRFNLKGVHGELQETDLAGHIDTVLTSERQSGTAELAQDGMQLALRAEHAGDLVQVQQFRLQARGGELQGRARLSLAAMQPYTVTAQLSGFDPSAWGNFPAGSLKGKIALDGTLKDKHVAALYTLGDSRLLGMPMSGRGDVRYAANRVIARYVELRLGRNAAAASGTLGGTGDALNVRVDANDLTPLDRRLAGRVNGSAIVTGTWQTPNIAFDLAAKAFAYGEAVHVNLLTAKGEYRHQRDPAFRVSATAASLATPAWRAERATVDAQGTQSAHTLAVRVRNADLDVALRAQGGLQGTTAWSGTVLDFSNRGTLPFALDSAVTVAIAPDHTQVGPFSARIMDGILQVGGVRYDAGRVTSDGRYRQLPLRPLLALAGVTTRPNDTLRLTGAWSLSYSPQLNGYFSVHRDAGDFTIGTDRPLALGLDQLDCDGKIVNDRLEVQGAIRSTLIAGKIEGTVSPVSNAAGERIGLDSPVRFSVAADVARLAAFSGLADANVHVDGRARAALSGHGTVRNPIVSGTLAADQLIFVLPPQGVELRDGVLNAQIADNEVRVQQFTIHGGSGVFSAQGTLGAAAKRASLDWRADHLTLLGRPDRRLVVTGNGNAKLEEKKISFSGQLRADEGSFQFGGGSLPTLGDDVVVVGRPPPQKQQQAATLAHAILDVAVDLGNNLHIAGEGLDAWINGKVRMRSDASGKIVAEGNVLTERGSYTAFGQRLQIERGRLIFNGPVEKPGLDVVALRKNQAVEAGVAVTGAVDAPYVRIVSEPPVPENEALAWLVLGHGPADASRGDLAMLPLAAASLFGNAKTPQGSIAQKLGVDTIALRGSTLNSQVVAVGKRLSHNLYVIYEQGLSATSNVLKLELNMTQRWLMRAEAGQTSSLGVFFRYAFD